MRKPLVYIAGPYTRPCPVANTRRAMEAWRGLWESRLFVPVCPHLSLFMDMMHPRPYTEWLDYDLLLLERCDAVYRLPGESAGADREAAHAAARGIPVFMEEERLRWWATTLFRP